LLVPDVNVLLNAQFTSQAHHASALRWLEATSEGAEIVGIPNLVFSAFVRIATNPNASSTPLSTAEAFAYCDHLRQLPATTPLREGPRHWDLFRSVVLASGVAGPDVSDAYLAAFAIENNATFVTFDRGFRRFEGLKTLVLD